MPIYGIIADLKTRIGTQLQTISGLYVYTERMPESGYRLPTCLITELGGGPDREVGLGTLNPFRRPVFQFDVWAFSESQAEQYADLVQAKLYETRFTLGTVTGGSIAWGFCAAEPRQIPREGRGDPYHVTMDWEYFITPT